MASRRSPSPPSSRITHVTTKIAQTTIPIEPILMNTYALNDDALESDEKPQSGEMHRSIMIQEEDVPIDGEYRREGKIKKWLILLGLVEPPGSTSGPAYAIWKDALISLLLALILFTFAYVSYQFRIKDFSSFWPTNGIYVGCFLASHPRLRCFLPFTFLVANLCFSRVAHMDWKPSTVFSFGVTNGLESLGVSLITLIVLGKLEEKKRGRVEVDFRRKKTLAAFAVGCCYCFISAGVGAAMARYHLGMGEKFRLTYGKWVGRNIAGITMITPFILTLHTLIKTRHTIAHKILTSVRARPYIHLLLLPTLYALLITCPTLSIFLIDDSLVSAIIGLYLCYPLVLLVSSFYGLFGASTSIVCVGFTSATAALIRYKDPNETTLKVLSIEDEFIYIQLFLTILVFTALMFVAVMCERDLAFESVEGRVRERTEELRMALEEVERGRKVVEEKERDKAVFLGFLCHELRNPLHAIVNVAEFLGEDLKKDGRWSRGGWKERGSDEEKEEDGEYLEVPTMDNGFLMPHVERRRPSIQSSHSSNTSAESHSPSSSIQAIKHSSTYMLALINDVLDYGRYEAGRVETESIVVDLHQLLNSNFTCAKEVAKRQGIKFEGIVGKGVMKVVRTDPVRYQQVLNNFVSNAGKFTPEGGTIVVKVEAVGEAEMSGNRNDDDGMETVCITAREGDGFGINGKIVTARSEEMGGRVMYLKTSVTDTGIGMDGETLRTLFRPYAQATVSTMREYGGSGLGLAITDKIVRCMGGRIDVNTAVGKGSTFSFTVPVGMIEEGKCRIEIGGAIGGVTEASFGSEYRKDNTMDSEGNPTILADRRKTDETLDVEEFVVDATTDETPVSGDTLTMPSPRVAASIPSDSGEPVVSPAAQTIPELVSTMPIAAPIPNDRRISTVNATDTQNSETTPVLLTCGVPTIRSRDAISTETTISASDTRDPQHPTPPPESPPPSPPKRILVVDDSKINRTIAIRMLKRIFTTHSMPAPTIDEAENGAEAIDKVLSLLHSHNDEQTPSPELLLGPGASYDIIFMDVMMPVMDGFEATRRVREMRIETPIVIATANQVNGNAEGERRMREVGGSEAVGKPFSKGELEGILRRYGVL